MLNHIIKKTHFPKLLRPSRMSPVTMTSLLSMLWSRLDVRYHAGGATTTPPFAYECQVQILYLYHIYSLVKNYHRFYSSFISFLVPIQLPFPPQREKIVCKGLKKLISL